MINRQGSGFLDSIPTVTRNLLIINVLVFLAFSLLTSVPMLRYLALFYYKSPFFMPHQFITYMFMHGNFLHIFFNMFGLFMFGRVLESVWGPKRFLMYYMLTGIGAALCHLLIVHFQVASLEAQVSPDTLSAFYAGMTNFSVTAEEHIALNKISSIINIPMVGASGALYGILIAFGMMFPNVQLFIIPIPIPIKAKYMVMGLAAIALFSGISNSAGDNVAHFAHLGGFITGLIFLLYWKKKGTLNGNFFR